MIEFLNELKARGFVQDATPRLAERLAQGPITAYIGFDATAASFHVGNLVPIMGLAWLQRFGGTPIALVGGGTSMVGDPSGKRAERPVLPVEQIDSNARVLEAQLRHFMSFEGGNAARMLNNAAWLRELKLMEFLRDTGKHFTLSYMLQKESVKSRMETGISYTEFSYMLVQAYDFMHLFRSEHCELQMGGSDQWGNITAGRELVARREGKEVHGLVFPLFTTASGAKFGKSEGGNVWLDTTKTSQHDFYQFWLNTDDRDVEHYLKIFTFLPISNIAAILREHTADLGKRIAQRRLAEEVTRQVHKQEGLDTSITTSSNLFLTTEWTTRERDYAALAATIPTMKYSRADLEAGISLADALKATGLVSSKAEARRQVQQNAVAVNDVRVDAIDRHLTPADLQQGKYVLLQRGKKRHALVVVED